MAKNQNTQLLLPGETAWEVWSVPGGGGTAVLEASYPVRDASEIGKPPAGDFVFLFPIRAFTALPLKVHTDDASLFPDLAETHAERQGLRPDPLAGQLTDIFPVFSTPGETTILSVVLRDPQPKDLPLKSPKAFDISPRAFPARGNTLALWRELGEWVFAIHREGKLLYSQSTAIPASSPIGGSLVREIRIAIAQLSMQGIEAAPSAALVWDSEGTLDTSLLSSSLSVQTELAARPAPVIPEPPSELLPEDVRAARRAARKRQTTLLAVAALVFLYLGTLAYFGYGLWETRATTKKLLSRVEQIAPEAEAYKLHIEKWDELEHGISLEYNTVDILNRINRSIPPNSGLRLRTAVISPTEIRLVGEAPQPKAVNQFSLNLRNNNGLLAYEWQTSAPSESKRGWDFNFTATPPAEAP